MNDSICKALVCQDHVRLYLIRSTDLVQEARDRFDLYPCACAALGRTLSVGSLMGSMLKDEKEMLTISINGHGPIGSIIVDAYHDGSVRGFCSNPHVDTEFKEAGKLNVGAVVGTQGTLTVTKDLGMQENFSGTVELVSGEIGEDFAYYFTKSEQTPTAVSVGVLVDPTGNVVSAGALILQVLPDATETDISICEHVIEGLKPMSTIIAEYDDDCPCSKERMTRALSTLKKEDLQAMIEEDHGAEITCNFCNERYSFSEEELQEILDERL